MSTSVGDGCDTITGPGSMCVNKAPINGSPFIFASYLYQASANAFGHVELSDELGGPCRAGSPVVNGTDMTRFNGQEQAVFTPYVGDSQWAGNWWQKVGTSYTNWGIHCSLI